MSDSGYWSWQLNLGVGDLAAARFAISPLYETGQALGEVRWHAQHGRWRAGRPEIAGWTRWVSRQGLLGLVRTPLLDDLAFSRQLSYPEFLTPSPSSLWSSIEDELETVARTSPEDIAGSIDRVWRESPIPPAARRLLDDPRSGLGQVADELLRAHDALVRPHWPRLQSLLEADVAFKARRLAQGGYDAVFANLHPDATWNGTTLRVGAKRGRVVRLSPGGLVLAPTVFGPPTVTVKFTSSTRTALRYQARGAGAAFFESTHEAPAGLAHLIGSGRARVLAQLTAPSTPTQLAVALNVTPSAISQHLRVLRHGGLVRSDRLGRSVVYALTSTGAALLKADDSLLASSR